MSFLFRYVFIRHARLLLLTLLVGLALYLLTDLIERLDTFVEAQVPTSVIVTYFLARLPSIAAQILPAAFILAAVITLALMTRSRETTALEAGGISPARLTGALMICGVFWGIVQLAGSQFLGNAGIAYAERIWQEDVRKENLGEENLGNVWFVEGAWIVSMERLFVDGQGTGLNAYELSEDGLRFQSMIRASRFTARPGSWTLYDADRFLPDVFRTEHEAELSLPLRRDPSVFFVAEQEKPQNLPLWMMREAINTLRDTGSNVEGLVTAWHSRLAYAMSLVVMAVIASAIISWKSNIYLAVGISILVTFVFYIATVLGQSVGERGLLPPVLAAWGPEVFFLMLASMRLYIVHTWR